MNCFSISQLEQFSGIKAHTIRIWEQRYKGLTPDRSQGNTRSYNNSQLRRLLNIVSLMDSDYKVSELCSMSDTSLFKLVEEQLRTPLPKEEGSGYFINQLIAAGMSFDSAHFEKIFSNCVQRLGIRNTYVNVIYPMLEKIGLMWSADTMPPACEHFISNIIKQKLCTAIDSLPPAASSKSSWLLFLPENEFHEIGLLFSYYLIREGDHRVIYLGSNVPFDTLKDAVAEIAPSHLLFFLVRNDTPENSQEYLDDLKRHFTSSQIHVSGNKKLISGLRTGIRINWIHSVEDLEKLLSS